MSEDTAKKEPPAWLPLAKNVSDNVAQIQYPTDVWGFTSGLRKEFAAITGKLNGHPAKTELLLAHLAIMASHVNKRKAKDDAIRASRRQRIVAGQIARAPLERFNTPTAKAKGDA